MPNPVLIECTDLVASGRSLSAQQAELVLAEIMDGRSSEVQTAGFLMALRSKGESPEEIQGLATTMRKLSLKVSSSRSDLVDTAGTGGGSSTFNVSTTAALLAASAGCAVAKHGNRSSTSKSGSADLLESLGVSIQLSPEAIGQCIDQLGFGFMFAPAHHSAMKYVVPVRKELAVRTVFNLLGPLTNPAGAKRQLIGVSEPTYAEHTAKAAQALGVKHALVVTSRDGLDELSTSAPTDVFEVRDNSIDKYTVEAKDFGLPEASLSDLSGGDPAHNALVTKAIFDGAEGPKTDLALLNAGAAVYVSGKASTIKEGLDLVRSAVNAGQAKQLLERYIALTQELEVKGK